LLILGCNSQTKNNARIIMEKHENGKPKIVIQYLTDTANFENDHYYENYYENGNLAFKGFISSGKRKGEWIWWNNSGEILKKKNYSESILNKKQSIEANHTKKDTSLLPIHGEINQEKLARYFPEVTDTIKDLRVIGSEKIDLNPGNGILVSILHNTGTFDQMIICTHDSNLILIDNLYIGKATDFDKTSHTIEYEIIDENSLKFDQVDWGYVKKEEEFEIDTLKYESYIITVNGQGKIKKK
jgi:hypothetical protein